MSLRRFFAVLFGLALSSSGPAWADGEAQATTQTAVTSPATDTLSRRIDSLEKDLAELKSPQGSAVSIYADPVRGLRFANADGTYGLQFSGLFQEDSRNYLYDGLNDSKGLLAQPSAGFVDARSRLIIDGLLGPRVKLRYQEDFSNNGAGPVLLDAYGDIKLAAWATLRLGQFKTPLEIDRWRNTPALDFIQYAYTGGLVTDRSQGVLFELADAGRIAVLDAGAVDGDTDAGSAPVTQSTNSDKDAVARIFFQPFHDLDDSVLRDFGLGAAGSAGNHSFAPEQPYKSEGQLTILSWPTAASASVPNVSYVEGAGSRIIPQAAWFAGPFSLEGEYLRETQGYRIAPGLRNEILASEAWQVAATWVVTGEHCAWDGLKLGAARGFSLGAIQVVARAQGADYLEDGFAVYGAGGSLARPGLIDPESNVQSLRSWTVGLNYIPVNDVKFLVDYDVSEFRGGGAETVGATRILADRPTEEAIQARAQFAF
jgi:phosphate-selective porin OprO/OprP